MAESSADLAGTTRKNLSVILQRLASAGQSQVAAALDVAESTVSRMKEKDLPELAKLLAVLGLKAVPIAMRCYEPKQISAILELAKARLAQIEQPSQLEWDGGE